MTTHPTSILGRRACDPVSGITGTVTGIVTYLGGHSEALLVPRSDDGVDIKAHWITTSRLIEESSA